MDRKTPRLGRNLWCTKQIRRATPLSLGPSRRLKTVCLLPRPGVSPPEEEHSRHKTRCAVGTLRGPASCTPRRWTFLNYFQVSSQAYGRGAESSKWSAYWALSAFFHYLYALKRRRKTLGSRCPPRQSCRSPPTLVLPGRLFMSGVTVTAFRPVPNDVI